MNKLAALLIPLAFACTSLVAADELVPELGAPITGTVREVKDVEHYTYLLLQTQDGEIWAAVLKTQVQVGADVTIADYQSMDGFRSQTLDRSFDRIVFGRLADMQAPAANAPANPHANPRAMENPHPMQSPHTAASPAAIVPVPVPRAVAADSHTVAEVVSGAAALRDQPVTVRGQVVKFTPDVMGANWLHLRDGTGAAADSNNDLLVVTADSAKIGEIVEIKGTVRTDRDLGSGYAYKVLVDEARLQR